MRLGRILLLLEEVRSLDDGSVAVTLNGFEVRPILGHHLGFPSPSAYGNQNVERQPLRRAWRQRS
jgi:hypothetical protein